MKTIVCLGDSITAGQYLATGKRWTILLKEGLGGNWTVLNRGRSGDTTRTGLGRFAQCVQEPRDNGGGKMPPPDYVLIQFGANDCNRWETDRGLPRVSPQSFRANLTEMVDRARAFGVEPALVTIAPAKLGVDYAQGADAYNTIILEVAAATATPVCDVSSALDGRAYSEFLIDGIHLNEHGHLLYAEVVIPFVKRLGRGWAKASVKVAA